MVPIVLYFYNFDPYIFKFSDLVPELLILSIVVQLLTTSQREVSWPNACIQRSHMVTRTWLFPYLAGRYSN